MSTNSISSQPHQSTLQQLYEFAADHEGWLSDRIMYYSKRNHYCIYTFPKPESWKLSIHRLSTTLSSMIKTVPTLPEVQFDAPIINKIGSVYDILDIRQCQVKGITLSMFLGLLKCYRQSYHDLLAQSPFAWEQYNRLYLDSYFNLTEMKFVQEWCSQTESQKMAELQTANRELIQQKEQYATMLDNLAEAIFFFDKTKKPQAVNQSARKLLTNIIEDGHDSNESVPSELPEDPAWLAEILFLEGTNHDSLIFGKELITRLGKQRFTISKRDLIDTTGNISGFFIILHEISDFQQKESISFNTSTYYEKIMNTIADPIFIKDRQHRWIYANDAFCAFKGRTREELLGKTNYDFDPKKEADLFWENDELVFSSGRINICEGIKTTSSGENHYAVTKKTLYTNEQGEKFIVAIIRDITDRKRAENRIRHAKEEWEKTMDCIKDMVLLVDDDGNIKRCNKPFKELIGLPFPQLLNKNWKQLLRETGIQVTTGDSHKAEILNPHSGQCFDIDIYPYKGHAYEEAWTGTVITLHDTTELKLSQSKILQQEKMASIGQLAAGVAHEINNPTGFIMSNLGSLQKYSTRLKEFIEFENAFVNGLHVEYAKEVADKKQNLKIDIILEDLPNLVNESLEGATRIKKIVQDLKNFSRIDDTEMKEGDINTGLESTINIVWNELKYKATIRKEYGNIPKTICNLGQLNQVFMNLLINGVQAIEKHGEISVKTWVDNKIINISISDTGCGIPRQKLNRIFEPFYTTKEVGKGTGLGLSIAYDIIKKHSGAIEVTSVEGKGTTFIVKIPIVAADGNQ